MKVADTSVIVAAFASWHPAHRAADDALTAEVAVAEHALIETYSVLTRLPPPHRVAPEIAARWLDERIGDRTVRATATSITGSPAAGDRQLRGLPNRAAAAGITGGAVYDILIALAARDADATLLTRDQRAIRIYDAMGTRYSFVGAA